MKLFIYFIVLTFLFISFKTLSLQPESEEESVVNENLTGLVDIFAAESEHSHRKESVESVKDFSEDRNLINKKFDSILSRYNLSFSKYSISVYSINSDNYFIEKNSDLFIKPASVTKLLTSYSILTLLSDTFNFRTYLYTEDEDLDDGIINGNVFVKGIGDPKITLSDLDELVNQLISMGIKKIEGRIIGDGTFYDKVSNRFSYSGDADEVEPVAPVSALSLEKNRIKIFVNTHVQGNIPKIQVSPNSDHFIVSNNLKIGTISKKGKKGKNIPQSRLSSHSKLNENGNQVIYLNGNLAPNSSFGVEDFNLTPELTFAGVLRNRLLSNGIKVIGNYEIIKKNKKIDYTKLHPIASITRSLINVVAEMNKKSDNYLAENLFMLAGAYHNHDSVVANSAKKLEDSLIHALSNYSQKLKSSVSEFKINDGSGLSRRNKFSSRMVCEMLKQISNSNYYKSFLTTLSVCGYDGTLAKRLKNTKAQMNLLAKTGTHNDVSALAGFVRDAKGDAYIFAFLFNGPSVGTYKMIENELGQALAEFSNNNINLKNTQ